jgi:hypothetical protein
VAKTDVSPGLCVPELLARSSLLGPIFLADVSILEETKHPIDNLFSVLDWGEFLKG